VNMKLLLLMSSLLVAGLLLVPGAGLSACAQAGASPGAEPFPGLEEFIDGLMTDQISNKGMVGAAVVVVKDGKQVFAKGYGFADLEKGIPVDPRETLFRVGSVSKLFTWTAVMQLVEQGQLQLYEDIGAYLNFAIPQVPQQKPITMWHLMTHTAGFADTSKGLLSKGSHDQLSLSESLARHIPERLYPPGQVTAYSNYGAALAGYIVERVSGKAYNQVIEETILRPLGMNRATLDQPLPPDRQHQVATGYVFRNGKPVAQPFEIIRLAPTGGLTAPVTDMGRFMIAHLQKGHYEEATLFTEATGREMHKLQFQNDPRLAGMALGFYQLRVNGRLFLTHAGDTTSFSSQMYLLPEENLGIFVVYNTPDAAGARRQELIRAFCRRYYPVTEAASAAVVNRKGTSESPAAAKGITQYTGLYVSTRRPTDGIEKLRQLFDPLYRPIRVVAAGNGLLQTRQASAGSAGNGIKITDWEEADFGLFQQTGEEGDEGWLVFTNDAGGRTFMFLDNLAPRGYQKLTRWEKNLYSPAWPIGLVLALAALLTLAVVVPQSFLGNRHAVILLTTTGLLVFVTVGYFYVCQFAVYLRGEVPLTLRLLPLLLGLNLIGALGLTISLVVNRKALGLGTWTIIIPIAAVLATVALQQWAWFWNLYRPV